jgi:hypothetical protein
MTTAQADTKTAAKKTKYEVRTDVGTFTRTSARSYSHVMVVRIKDDDADRPDLRGTWGAAGWSSSLDLAIKNRNTWTKRGVFAELRIYDVKTGTQVVPVPATSDECPQCSTIGRGPLCKAHYADDAFSMSDREAARVGTIGAIDLANARAAEKHLRDPKRIADALTVPASAARCSAVDYATSARRQVRRVCTKTAGHDGEHAMSSWSLVDEQPAPAARRTYRDVKRAQGAALLLLDALQVLTLTPAVRAFLEANDPKALQQAERAIAAATEVK